jgi:hypothetical protein
MGFVRRFKAQMQKRLTVFGCSNTPELSKNVATDGVNLPPHLLTQALGLPQAKLAAYDQLIKDE